MGKEPAPKGGATKCSEVDFDRLWRDRVNQELSNQRQWSGEYGFMVEGSQQRQQQQSVNQDTAAAGSTSDSAAAASLSYASTKSTMQASYGQRVSIEIKGDTRPFNRKKHPM